MQCDLNDLTRQKSDFLLSCRVDKAADVLGIPADFLVWSPIMLIRWIEPIRKSEIVDQSNLDVRILRPDYLENRIAAETTDALILALLRLYKHFSGREKVASQLSMDDSEIARWWRLPCEYFHAIEALTDGGFSRFSMRPDLFNGHCERQFPDLEATPRDEVFAQVCKLFGGRNRLFSRFDLKSLEDTRGANFANRVEAITAGAVKSWMLSDDACPEYMSLDSFRHDPRRLIRLAAEIVGSYRKLASFLGTETGELVKGRITPQATLRLCERLDYLIRPEELRPDIFVPPATERLMRMADETFYLNNTSSFGRFR